jgi:O-antigen/teichoic acid export membrane protein
MSSKFRSDTAIYGLAQVAERLISFFLLPLLTKAISPEEYGIWSQLIVVTGVSTPIVLLGLQTALVRYLPRFRGDMQVHNSLILKAFIAVAGSLILTVMVFIFFQQELGLIFFGAPGYSTFVLLLAGIILSEALFDFLVSVLRAGGLIRRIGYYLLLKSVTRLCVFIFVLLYLRSTFQVAVFSFVLCQLFFVFIFALYEVPVQNIAKAGLSPSSPYFGETFRFALPMMMLALLTGLNSSVDRFYVTHLLGVNEVSVYAAAYSLAAIAGFFYSILGFSLFPAMSVCWVEGRKDVAAQLLGKTVKVYLFFMLPFVAMLSICGPEILKLLATQQYQLPAPVFLFLAASVGLFGIYQVCAYAVILEGRTTNTIALMGSTAIANLGLNAVLIPLWGSVGAALAICVANGILAYRTFLAMMTILPSSNYFEGLLTLAVRSGIVGLVLFLGKSSIDYSNLIELASMLSLVAILYLIVDFISNDSILRLVINGKST